MVMTAAAVMIKSRTGRLDRRRGEGEEGGGVSPIDFDSFIRMLLQIILAFSAHIDVVHWEARDSGIYSSLLLVLLFSAYGWVARIESWEIHACGHERIG